MLSNADSALLQFSSTPLGLHLGQTTEGNSGKTGRGREGKGPSGTCLHGVTALACFVLCACTQACPLCHADHNVDTIQDQPAQPGSSWDPSAPKRAPGLVPALRKHRALAGQPSTSHMGHIPFRANLIRADNPSSPGQPSGVMARADMVGAEPASEGKPGKEDGREHEDDHERGHAERSVARYVRFG